MVLTRMKEYGYEPNQAARALVTGQSRMVILWMPSLSEPYAAMVIHHIQEQVIQHDYEMIIRDMRPRAGNEKSLLRSLRWPVDGMLVLDGKETLRSLLANPQRKRPPIVHMGAYYDRSVDCVGVDLRAGTVLAVRHLINTGCKRVAYLVPSYFNLEGDDRREGYLQVLNEAGLKPEFIESFYSGRAAAASTVKEYVKKNGCPDGIFCFNDDHAIATYRALKDIGIRVPDEVLIVGCDGIEDTEYLDCRITTIVQPIAQMCKLAWTFLERRMADPTYPRQETILIPDLVVRDSSTPANGLIRRGKK